MIYFAMVDVWLETKSLGSGREACLGRGLHLVCKPKTMMFILQVTLALSRV